MQVSVHKGIELMTVVWQISDSEFKEKHSDMFCGDPSYVGKIYEWFDKFKNEEVIHKFLELKFNFGAISWGYVLYDVYNLTIEAKD